MQNLEVFPTTGLHLGGDFTTNLFTRGMSKNISSSDWSNLNSLSCQLLKRISDTPDSRLRSQRWKHRISCFLLIWNPWLKHSKSCNFCYHTWLLNDFCHFTVGLFVNFMKCAYNWSYFFAWHQFITRGLHHKTTALQALMVCSLINPWGPIATTKIPATKWLQYCWCGVKP